MALGGFVLGSSSLVSVAMIQEKIQCNCWCLPSLVEYKNRASHHHHQRNHLSLFLHFIHHQFFMKGKGGNMAAEG